MSDISEATSKEDLNPTFEPDDAKDMSAEYEKTNLPTTPDSDFEDETGDEDDENLGDDEIPSFSPTNIVLGVEEQKQYSDEEDNETDDDEEALKKLDKDIEKDTLIKNHPEIIQHNYQEILALCTIVKNDKGIIVDELHKTCPFITKYEYARIVGIRAKQINNGAEPFINVNRGIIDGFTIAKLEMDSKKIPFIIARPLPNGSKEYWKVQDLEMVHF